MSPWLAQSAVVTSSHSQEKRWHPCPTRALPVLLGIPSWVGRPQRHLARETHSFPALGFSPLLATQSQHPKCDICVHYRMKSQAHLINTCCKYSVIPHCQGAGCEREEEQRGAGGANPDQPTSSDWAAFKLSLCQRHPHSAKGDKKAPGCQGPRVGRRGRSYSMPEHRHTPDYRAELSLVGLTCACHYLRGSNSPLCWVCCQSRGLGDRLAAGRWGS